MSKIIRPVYGNLHGGSVAVETLMGTLYPGDAGREIKVTDIAFTGNDPCWFWLATANDGTGHVYSYFLSAAGGDSPTLDTPICLAVGETLFAMYNSLDGGTRFEVSFTGELLQ